MQHPVYKTKLWCSRGHFNEAQADKYAELCDELQPAYVLEIGFCTGRSAVSVLHQTRETLVTLISVDKNLDYQRPDGRLMASLLRSHFPAFSIIEQNSRDTLNHKFFSRAFPLGVDLATVDGDHSYEGCRFDLQAISPFLSSRGVMVVDDYKSGPPHGVRFESVTRSVDEFLAEHHRDFRGEVWNHCGKGFCIIRRAG